MKNYLLTNFSDDLLHQFGDPSIKANGFIDDLWCYDINRPEREWLSNSFWENLGLNSVEYENYTLIDNPLIVEEDKKKILSWIEDLPKHKKLHFNFSVEFKNQEKNSFQFEIKGVVVQQDGQFIRLVGTIKNCTLNDELYVLIKQTESLNNIIKSLEEGFQIIDREFRYVYLNEKAEKHSLMPPKSLLGKTMTEVYPGIENTELFNQIKDSIINKNAHVLENEFTYPDGQVGFFQLSIQPIPEGVLILSTDITEIKKAQQEINKKNVELARFNHIAAHDLQEPLNSIIAYSNLLRMELEDCNPSSIRRTLDVIELSTNRMKSFITALLEYSKLGIKSAKKEVIDLEVLLTEVESDLHFAINESKCTITKKLEVKEVKGFDIYLAKLIQNLLMNAIKYKKQNIVPEIEISTFKDRQNTVFCISDNGIGIQKKFFPKIFEVFKRLHTKEEYSGTGIGLASCKKIVEMHNGEIWLESEIDVGTKMYFSIPNK